jgi:exo beta-1,2-glucooligosaccharide sophorohydrolase (non-reducing end)
VGYERHVDLSWKAVDPGVVKYIKIYRSDNNRDYFPVGVQSPEYSSRYADFTGTPGKTYSYRLSSLNYHYVESELSASVQAKTYEMNDDQLLDMIQEACFRYYWDGAEPVSGLALENIPGRKNMIATGASGFGIMALLVGAERGFITREQLIDRLNRIVKFIENGDRFHGALSHFMDGPTGKVEPFFGKYDDGGDLVETSFFMQGLLTASQYLSEENPGEKALKERMIKIWKDVEWDWYRRTDDNPFLMWHWSPQHEWHINHPLIGWNETLITYFLAIASPTNAVPADMYYSGWASQSKQAQDYRSNWGGTADGSMFYNRNTYYGVPLEVGVSNGGPLFFVHYSFLGLDPQKLTDRYTNYFENNRNITLINYRYCCENPHGFPEYGKKCWGLTASDGPWGYKAREPVERMDDGTIAPTGALASFPYLPEQAMQALKFYYRECGHFLWGEYGFRDAFNLTEDWVAPIFMGLNQAPVTVMIENYRTGLLWNLFMSSPDVREGLNKLDGIKKNK